MIGKVLWHIMKLNLGCGRKKLEGFVNIDISDYCEPDMVMDLSKVPYL